MFQALSFLVSGCLGSSVAGGIRKGVKWRWWNSCRIGPDIRWHTYAVAGIASFIFRVGLAFAFRGILVIKVISSCRCGIKIYFSSIGYDG